MDGITNNFTSVLYNSIHKVMQKSNFTYTELMQIPPLEFNIFKSFIIQDIKKKNK